MRRFARVRSDSFRLFRDLPTSMLSQNIGCLGPSLDLDGVEESLAWSAAYLFSGPGGGQGYIADDIWPLRIATPLYLTAGVA